MPQKQPPASTAVSSPALCADASAAGGGIVTADSASAASGLKARAVARSRAEERIMVSIPRHLSPPYRDEFGAWLHTTVHDYVREVGGLSHVISGSGPSGRPGMTCEGEDPVIQEVMRRAPAPGGDYNLPATFL